MKNPFSLERLQQHWRDVSGALHNLRSRELSPRRAASSVACGLFVGSTPFYGFHFPICAGLSYIFGLDLIVTYLAANISIAPVVPIMVFSQVQIGTFVLEGHWLTINLSQLNLQEALDMTKRLLVGAFLVGSVLAIIGGSLTYWITRHFKPPSDAALDLEISRTLRLVSELYRQAPAAHRHYVSSKLRLDPLTRELFLLARSGRDFGRVIDAGCGRGQFALLLLILGAGKSVFGFDHDEPKVAAARLAASTRFAQNAIFESGDLRNKELPAADSILLLDVLHYLPFTEQSAVLQRMAQALPVGGHLLVRETNHPRSPGARLAKLLERLARLLGFNRGERLDFLAPRELVEELRALGFQVEQQQSKGVLDNVLLVAQKLV